MQKHHNSSRSPQFVGEGLSLAELEYHAANWHLDAEVRQFTKGTVFDRRQATKLLLWFLRQREFERCGTFELRPFFAYLNTAHTSEDDRWGDACRNQPLRPAAAKFYHSRLQTFFNFLVEEGVLERSPMAYLKAPIVRQDQVQPFTREQQEALLRVARKTRHPKRDEAIVLFLLDTGARASELCSLRVGDLDMTGRRCQVRGKGEKTRTICFGATTTKALWAYRRAGGLDKTHKLDAPLFTSDRGPRTGEALTRWGLLQLIERLGEKAGIEACRCSPHTFRHTFAITFLRNGGNTFALQQKLGHTDLDMTRRYVAIGDADVALEHRQFSAAIA